MIPSSLPLPFLPSSTAPDDYVPLSRAIVIPAGVTQTSVDLTIEDDLVMEVTETLLVSLAVAEGQTGVRLGPNATATVSITDDDGRPMYPLLAGLSLLCFAICTTDAC